MRRTGNHAPMLLAIVLAGCGSGHGGRGTEIARVPSPDRAMEAVLVPNADSGAFGDESMSVMLVPAGGDPKEGLCLLTGSHLGGASPKAFVDMRWADSSHLTLSLRAGEIQAFQNYGSIRTAKGIHTLGIRLDAPFFGHT